MKMNVIAHHCHVLADGTVIPDPGYEGPRTEQGPFRGSCSFDWIKERGTEPHLIVAKRSASASATTATTPVLPFLPVFRIAALQYDTQTWDSFGLVWGAVSTVGPSLTFATNQGFRADPATAADDTYSVMQVINGRRRELKRIYVYPYRGQDNGLTGGGPPYAFAGINNRVSVTPLSISVELWRADYDDVAGSSFTHSLISTLSGTLNPTAGSGTPLDNGVVDDIDFNGVASSYYIDVSGTVLEVLFEEGVDLGYWYYFKNLTLLPP